MSYCVYCHTSPDGKKYVGCTSTSPEQRFRSGHGYERNPRFWADICKFGWEAFEHEILFTELDSETAHELEYQLIHELNLLDPEYGYNLWDECGNRSPDSVERIRRSRLGNKNSVGRVHSPEMRKRISETLIKYYETHEHPLKGKHLSPETIEKLRNRKISEETRRRMRKSHANVSGAENPSAKAVAQYSKNGEFIAEYSFATEAANKYGIELSSIIKCCRGKLKSAGGYVWKYVTV